MKQHQYSGWKFSSLFKAGTPDEWQTVFYVGIADVATAFKVLSEPKNAYTRELIERALAKDWFKSPMS